MEDHDGKSARQARLRSSEEGILPKKFTTNIIANHALENGKMRPHVAISMKYHKTFFVQMVIGNGVEKKHV